MLAIKKTILYIMQHYAVNIDYNNEEDEVCNLIDRP